MAQRCTSWCLRHRARVQIPGTNPMNIMCLLDGVPVKVQAPRWVAHQHQCLMGSSSCGWGSSNLEPPEHGKAVTKHHLGWLFLVANEGLMERPQPSPLIHIVCLYLSVQQYCQNDNSCWRHRPASRFDGASKVAAKAIV